MRGMRLITAVTGALLCAWCCILLLVPVESMDMLSVSLATHHSYSAAGLLVAALVSIPLGRAPVRPRRLARIALMVFGILATVGIAVDAWGAGTSWYGWPAGTPAVMEVLLGAGRLRPWTLPYWFFTSALGLGIACVGFLSKAMEGRRLASGAAFGPLRVTLAVTVALGALRAPALMWCLPHATYPADASVTLPGFTPLTWSAGEPMAAVLVTAVGLFVIGFCAVRSSAGIPAERAVEAAALEVGSGALGMLLWTACSQLWMPFAPDFVVSSRMFCALGVAFMTYLMTVTILAPPSPEVESQADHGSDEGPSVSVSPLLDERLTERESTCLELALAGENSAHVAEKLGIKASTVRSYLQRAYRKLEVDSLEQARDVLPGHAEDRLVDSVATVPPTLPCTAGTLGRVVTVLPCATLPLGCALSGLPIDEFGDWGAGLPYIVALLTVASIGCWGQIVCSVTGGSCRPWSSASLAPIARMALAAWGILCGTLLHAQRAGLLGASPLALLPHDTLVGALYAGLLAAGGMLALGALGASAWRQDPYGEGLIVAVPAVCAAVCLIVSRAMPHISVCLIIVGCVSAAVAALLNKRGHHGAAVSAPNACEAPDFSTAAPGFFAVGVVMGCAAEEIWRDINRRSHDFSLLMAIVLIAAIAVAFLLVRGVSRRAARRIIAAVPLLALGLWGYKLTVAALLLCGIAVGVALRELMRIGAADDREVWAMALGAGIGAFIGFKAVNAYEDMLVDSSLAYYALPAYARTQLPLFGGMASEGAVSLVLSGGVFVFGVASVACLALFSRRYRLAVDEVQALVALADVEFDETRVRSYLTGRGLSALQADVVLRVVGGQTSGRIASELHYAVGTVNTARDVSYKTLRVHNRAELAALLKRDAGL